MISSELGQAPPTLRHLRVPRTDGSWLQRPLATEAMELLGANIRALAEAEVDVQGIPLSRLKSQARDQAFRAATAYTGMWTATPDNFPESAPWIVGGHQPALYHPGVWAKNFAIGRLARQVSGVSLNLVVDNDTLNSESIRVPTGSLSEPRVEQVPFDSARLQQPWEDVRVQDRGLFESFADRVSRNLGSWNYEPVINEYWPQVVAGTAGTGRIADGFTIARNQWERQWELKNLELPLSHLCQLPAFMWFAAHLLAQLPRFWSIYNSAVQGYRRANGIHSTSHPVPELAQIGDWLEAPFWIWRAGDRRRSRLFARLKGDIIELAVDGQQPLGELPLTPEGDAEQAVTRLQELQAAGLHLRTRALTTTLFSRVCLADLFVHGIGGAKYDEITDQLIAEFWGIPVPHYWTVSGTLHLPLPSYPVGAIDLEQCQRQLWDLQWNPTRALGDSDDPQVLRLGEEFQQLLAEPMPHLAARRVRHGKLSNIKLALAKRTQEQVPAAKAKIEEVTKKLAANRILLDREYSYLLYPAEKLRRFLNDGPIDGL